MNRNKNARNSISQIDLDLDTSDGSCGKDDL